MNDLMRGKIEACLELSTGDPEKFKRDTMKVTGMTDQGFHVLALTDTAHDMLKRGEDVSTVINAVL